MIESSLTLKRFADKAVEGLFAREAIDTIDTDDDIDQVTLPSSKHLSSRDERAELRRKLELEDAIRVGFKLGMGSRQNAPAEWIGESPPDSSKGCV